MSEPGNPTRPVFRYKGYSSEYTQIVREATRWGDASVTVEFTYRGKVAGIKDTVTFVGSGKSDPELLADTEQAFRDSVDDYLEFCAELGREPERPK